MPDAGFIQNHLGHGHKDKAFQLSGAALGFGIKHPDRFQHIPKKIQAAWRLGPRRKDIQQATAQGKIARLHHRPRPGIAVVPQISDHRIQFYRLADTRRKAVFGKAGFGRHPLQGGIDGGENDQIMKSDVRFAEPVQRGHAHAADIGNGRHPVIGQTVPGRKLQHLNIRGKKRKRLRHGCSA